MKIELKELFIGWALLSLVMSLVFATLNSVLGWDFSGYYTIFKSLFLVMAVGCFPLVTLITKFAISEVKE